VLIAGAGLYALIGFPLDDIWHRLFGQDVTLWGPTHLMLIGGAGLSLIGVLLLEYEGRVSRVPSVRPDTDGARRPGRFLLEGSAFGGLLIGLSVFQIEYDFGVEQFRLVLQPMMIAGAAAFALVAARMTLGRGAAVFAALFAILIRGIVAVAVGPVLGEPHNVFPLYLGAAVVVELLALTPLLQRRLAFGLVGGLAVATVGLWIESWWIDAAYLYPWPTSMWAEALAMAVPVGVVAGACGALLATVLSGEALPRPAVRRGLVVALVLVIGAATASGVMVTVPEKASATVTLTDVAPQNGRMVTADVRIDPADLAGEAPEWVAILSWQGGTGDSNPGRGLVVDRLERLGPGHYRSTMPMPVHGTAKTLLRVQDGSTMTAVPIFLPNDPGIGAQELPALNTFTRLFVPEISVLQRERSFNHPSWLYSAASLVVLVCSLILVGSMAWGAGRINRLTRERPATPVNRDRTPTSL